MIFSSSDISSRITPNRLRNAFSTSGITFAVHSPKRDFPPVRYTYKSSRANAAPTNSAINGVKFHRENPDAGPEASHNSWLREKGYAGWKYGEVKDEEKKTHPCMMPFDELPAEQKAKDYLFRQVVHSLMGIGK